jgi:Dinucleotide-utilizing enzymes involved in molybdopterin and thiamine biosynthesis family 1
VGKAAAQTLALEGIGGGFRLADYDTLSLSNLNRLQGGIQHVGLNKAVLAARQLFEINPFLQIELFEEGITESNIDTFFDDDCRLDLLIEECDDLYVKVRLREAARERRIPVLMETSDRGLLDIERFDREPDRPLFHGVLGSIKAADLKGLSTKEKLPIVLKILDVGQVSATTKASMLEIEETLETWPQLGSAVTLGGAVITDTARRILLGHLQNSGRFYIDLETLVQDQCAFTLSKPIAKTVTAAVESCYPISPYPRPAARNVNEVSSDEVRFIAFHGSLAPSAGNVQPWRFEWRNQRLDAIHLPDRSWALLDFNNCASYVAFGAVAENIDLAARELGLRADIKPFPDTTLPELIFRARFQRDAAITAETPLFEQIRLRVTNRRLGLRQPLTLADETALQEVAHRSGTELSFLTESSALDQIGEVIACCDRSILLNQQTHRELVGEIRWNPEQVLSTRDGIDIGSLHLSAADAAVMQLLTDWAPLSYLSQIKRGRGLERNSRKMIAAASAVGLLTFGGIGPLSYFNGGRAMQRVWLTATALGLAFHPMTALPYLLARLRRGKGEGLTAETQQQLTELGKSYRHLLPIPDDHAEIMLFRLAKAELPTVRSLRRSLDEILMFC